MCNYKIIQFPIKVGWRDAPLALWNLAETIKQNILIRIKICIQINGIQIKLTEQQNNI